MQHKTDMNIAVVANTINLTGGRTAFRTGPKVKGT